MINVNINDYRVIPKSTDAYIFYNYYKGTYNLSTCKPEWEKIVIDTIIANNGIFPTKSRFYFLTRKDAENALESLKLLSKMIV